jgi:hypothetical protein
MIKSRRQEGLACGMHSRIEKNTKYQLENTSKGAI